MGGLFVRTFQLRHATEVAGVVFVDAAHEDGIMIPVNGKAVPVWNVPADQFRSAIEAMIPRNAPPAPPPMNPSTDAPFDKLPPNVLTTRVAFEMRALKAFGATPRDQMIARFMADQAALVTLHEAAASQPPLGRTPLVVLTPAIIQDPGWEALQTKLTALSTNSSHRVVARSGGEIHLSDPAAVVRAVQDVVTAARQGRNVPRH
jgi:pimeloyl-ACP methyl ester carboxylesterase